MDKGNRKKEGTRIKGGLATGDVALEHTAASQQEFDSSEG